MDDSEIEDIYVDGFMVIYRKSLDPDFKIEVSFQSLLRGVCNNFFLKKLRKKSNFNKIANHISEVHYNVKSFEKEIEFIDEFNLVMKHLEALEPKCRTMIKSFYLDGKSLESIASGLEYKMKLKK